jgi:hypothetical protein
LIVAVNLDQRDEIRLRDVSGESFVDRSDLVGSVRPVSVDLKESLVSLNIIICDKGMIRRIAG